MGRNACAGRTSEMNENLLEDLLARDVHGGAGRSELADPEVRWEAT